MPHLIQAIASAVAMVFYIPLLFLFTMASMDLNPGTLSNMSSAHSMIEVTNAAIKVTSACIAAFPFDFRHSQSNAHIWLPLLPFSQ